MEELIKEADELYDKLMRVIRHINTTEFDKDDSIAIIESSQLLRRLVERKDNIVDLGEVWHSIDVEPQKGSWFVGQIGDYAYDTFIAEIEGKSMKEWFIGCNIKRWAYIKDLLPKGGEAWNTTK